MGAVPAGAQWGPRPIPEPTDGLKDAYKDYFKIGVAVNNHNVAEPREIAVVLREFNSITAENAMKLQPTEPEKGVFHWEDADRIADFCRAHGIRMRGHTLMWHSQIGTWMYQDKDGNLLPKEEFYANMKHHIQAIVNRYKDIVYCWDVVNEAVADSPVWPGRPELRESPMYKIAGEEFIWKAFEYAHEADPDALLFYNDYNDAEPAKSQRIYNLVKRMKDAGVPVDGIGMQGHYNIYGPSSEDVDKAVTLYSTIVDHIHVTELDVRVNTEMGGALRFSQGGAQIADWEKKMQEDQYARLFKVFRKHRDVIDCVTFWNVSDKDSWLGVNNYPLLFDAEYKPKQAYLTVKHFDPAMDSAVILEDFRPSELNQPALCPFQGLCAQGHFGPFEHRPPRDGPPQGCRRLLDRYDRRTRGRRLPLLPPDHRRRRIQRPRYEQLLRLHPLGKRHRGPGPRRGVLRHEGRAARQRPAGALLVRKHETDPSGLCLYPAAV